MGLFGLAGLLFIGAHLAVAGATFGDTGLGLVGAVYVVFGSLLGHHFHRTEDMREAQARSGEEPGVVLSDGS